MTLSKYCQLAALLLAVFSSLAVAEDVEISPFSTDRPSIGTCPGLVSHGAPFVSRADNSNGYSADGGGIWAISTQVQVDGKAGVTIQNLCPQPSIRPRMLQVERPHASDQQLLM